MTHRQEAARYNAHLVMKIAHQIRVDAALDFDCCISEIHWGECLKEAWRKRQGKVLVEIPSSTGKVSIFKYDAKTDKQTCVFVDGIESDVEVFTWKDTCLLYTSPSPRDS